MNPGTLAPENPGTLEPWNPGTLEPWNLETLPSQLISLREATALAETFKMLGDPSRVRILDVLAHGEICVCDLATLLGATESAVSHQLRLLRGTRLVRARRSGRQIFYTLDDDHIRGLFGLGLEHVQEASRGVAGAA